MIERRAMRAVSPQETGPDSQMTLLGMQKRMMDISLDHSEQLGCGWNAMRAMGAFWAITRIKIRMDRRPVLGEAVIVRTWPNPATSTGVDRNYRVTNWEGRLLAEGMAKWTIVDLRDGKPLRANEFPLVNQALDYSNESVWQTGFDRFPPLETEDDPFIERLILASDLDANHHVNNLRYLVFVQEAIEGLIHTPLDAQECQIHYHAPLFAGEVVRIGLHLDLDTWDIEGTVLRDHRRIRSFRCRIR